MLVLLTVDERIEKRCDMPSPTKSSSELGKSKVWGGRPTEVYAFSPNIKNKYNYLNYSHQT